MRPFIPIPLGFVRAGYFCIKVPDHALNPCANRAFLAIRTSYDALPHAAALALCDHIITKHVAPNDIIYKIASPSEGIFLIHEGDVEIFDENEEIVSHLGLRNSFGERGLLRDGKAATTAQACSQTTLLLIPKPYFLKLLKDHTPVQRFFDRTRPQNKQKQIKQDLATLPVDSLMARNVITCPPSTTVRAGAILMRDNHVSSLCITENETLCGIVTTADMSAKVLAQAMSIDTPLAQIMTPNPLTLSPQSLGSDVLHVMMERRISHVPILQDAKLVGLVSKTDLTRFQAVSSGELIREIATSQDSQQMRLVTQNIPQLLVQLVAAGRPHQVVTRLITDIADTATRRLVDLAQEKLGPPPVPFLWLACGSQGRQEQTGVSDQDNCLILHDKVSDEDRLGYFSQLAKFVCDGLDVLGYVYCPGDMMATNPKWCQPLSVWQGYFNNWIAKPVPEAQMLASVMFDLRPISGDHSLFDNLQSDTLRLAAKNSIFVAHMVSNSLKHTPPLGLFRGFATIKSGEHKNHLDMKHNGVVPIVDLGRVYALEGRLNMANTRARIEAAVHTSALSATGGRDLLDAYDLIADTRLEHQANQVKMGQAPDNYLAPSDLSDFERSHLRDAFVVVKTLQSALGHGRTILG